MFLSFLFISQIFWAGNLEPSTGRKKGRKERREGDGEEERKMKEEKGEKFALLHLYVYGGD